MAQEAILAPNLVDIENESGPSTRDAIRLLWLRLFARKAAVVGTSGGTGDGFGVIASPAQPSVHADQPNDQLNIIGNGIAIELDPATDTVTLSLGLEEGVNTHIEETAGLKYVSAFYSTSLSLADSPYTVGLSDDATVFKVDTSSGDVEINLSDASVLPHKHLIFIKTTDDINEVRIYPASGDTIDDFPGVVLTELDEFAEIYSDSADKWLSLQCCDLTSTGFETVVCTSNPMKVAPSAAASVSVTPSSTSSAWSSWVEIEDVTPAPWMAAAVLMSPPLGVAVATVVIISIGVGAVGEEETIGTLSFYVEDAHCNNYVYFLAPLDKIPAGARVSVRFRKGNTDTTAWKFKLAYYEKPVVGGIISTKTTFHDESGYAAVPGHATPWNNSAWVQVGTSPNPAGRMLGGVSLINSGILGVTEMDVGTGTSTTNVTVVQTFKDAFSTSAFPLGGGIYRCVPPIITDNMRAGEFPFVRVRSSVAGGTSYVAPLWIDNFEGTDKITKKKISWTPSAAAGTLISSSVTPWANPAAFTQLIASTTNASALIGIILDTNGNNTNDSEIDIAVGAAASEVVVSTFRYFHGQYLIGNNYFIPLPIPRDIPASSRVSARLRSGTASKSIHVGVGLIDNPDFAWRHAVVQKALPSAANSATVAANTTAWANSSTATLVAINTITSAYKVTGVMIDVDINDVEFEADLLINGVYASTIPYKTSASDPGVIYIPLPAPLCVPANAGLTARFRKAGTAAGTFAIAVTYV